MTRLALYAVLALAVRSQAASLTVDYPSNATLFPPDIAAPTFLWRDSSAATHWRIDIEFADGTAALHIATNAPLFKHGPVDERALGPTNAPPQITPQLAVTRTWRASKQEWATIKTHSVKAPARIAITGLDANGAALSSATLTLSTSTDPVGAPIFYRDVPLMPSETEKGVIKPLAKGAVPLIAWRLRDVAQDESKLLLTGMPTCANCHSFSRDGKTLGMDLDGPQNDKGLYTLAAVHPRTTISPKDVIEWRSVKGKLASPIRVGFMSQVSPDGQNVVTTINPVEAGLAPPGSSSGYYVANFTDYRFLQVFYLTRGVLAWYNRSTGKLQPLAGADDPRYVNVSAFWTPDGKELIFERAEARDPYAAGRELAKFANDPNETQIQYNLYRIPFNEGRGGTPVAIAGASHNGMSNTFPKVSPDGRWIVFTQCKNGQLMRPDGQLYIVPIGGGTARRLNANTPLMNSWHSWSPNSRWLVFSSKARSPYTQLYLTHIDENGNDTPAVLIENSTASNRAVNIPEFLNVSPSDAPTQIDVPSVEFYRQADIAYELAKKGETAPAIAAFERALQLDPDDTRAHANFGIALGEAGRVDEAIRQFETALRIDPRNADALVSHASLLAKRGRIDQATPLFERALQLDPRNARAQSGLCGTLAMQPGRASLAVEHCDAALALTPDDAQAHTNYAIALSQIGRMDEAITHLERASELMPTSAEIHSNLGAALAQRGRADDAIKHLEKAVALAPTMSEARYNLATLYYRQHRVDDAAREWCALYQCKLNDAASLHRAAQTLATSPDDDVRNGTIAVELMQRAMRLSTKPDAALLDTLAAALAEAGAFPQAINVAQQAVEMARAQSKLALAKTIEAKLALYKSGRPYRATR